MRKEWCESHECPAYWPEKVSGLWPGEQRHRRRPAELPRWGGRGRENRSRLQGEQRTEDSCLQGNPTPSRAPPSGLQLSADGTSEWRPLKEPPERLRRNSAWGSHTGLGTVPTASRFLFTQFSGEKEKRTSQFTGYHLERHGSFVCNRKI